MGELMNYCYLLLTSLAWLNFAGNLWTDERARVTLTSPALDTPRQRVDPWSRNAIRGEQKHFPEISFMQFPIINSMTLGPAMSVAAIFLQSSGAVSWPDQHAADDPTPPSSWSVPGASWPAESSTPGLQRVQRVSSRSGGFPRPWLEDRGRPLLRRSQWSEKQRIFERMIWLNFVLSLFRSSWCLPRHSVQLTQSTAVVTAVAE